MLHSIKLYQEDTLTFELALANNAQVASDLCLTDKWAECKIGE